MRLEYRKYYGKWSRSWKLHAFGQHVAWLSLYIGAGWSRPNVMFTRYGFTVYLSFGRGICFGVGWSSVERNIQRAMAGLSDGEKLKLADVLREITK